MIIAIEGIDGSGKSLQFSILEQKLKDSGKRVIQLSFPRYETFVGKEIGSMLSGNSSVCATNVDAKSMALWYAVDRLKCFSEADYNDYDYILLNRYVLSNAVYQGMRVAEEERRDFARWVFELEHGEFKLPLPDKYIVLDVDTKASASNIIKKGYRDYTGDRPDVYESESGFMDDVRRLYLEFAEELGNVSVVRCMRGGGLLPPEEIHRKIEEIIGI